MVPPKEKSAGLLSAEKENGLLVKENDDAWNGGTAAELVTAAAGAATLATCLRRSEAAVGVGNNAFGAALIGEGFLKMASWAAKAFGGLCSLVASGDNLGGEIGLSGVTGLTTGEGGGVEALLLAVVTERSFRYSLRVSSAGLLRLGIWGLVGVFGSASDKLPMSNVFVC